ncbi:MAG: helix-turn-helix domain-containing protein [Pirellulales bacterium]
MNVITEDQAKDNIAANLQRLLEARNWSQSDLARATGDAHVTISRIVRGTNVAGVALLARIAEALDVTIDGLIRPPASRPSKKSA